MNKSDKSKEIKSKRNSWINAIIVISILIGVTVLIVLLA